MLDEISPVQVIEGVNECAEAADTYINTLNYPGVAIGYIPKVSYSLNKLGIFLTHQEPLDGGNFSSFLLHVEQSGLLFKGVTEQACVQCQTELR